VSTLQGCGRGLNRAEVHSRARNLHVLPVRSPRHVVTARWRQVLALAAAALLLASLVGLAALPTGAASAEEVVPHDARVAARTSVGGALVLLLARDARVQILVAYHRDEGWHGVAVPAPPARSAAAWAATRGGGGVPALSVVYGRTDGARIRVEWVDGQTADAAAGPDHAYLVARRGHVRSKSVSSLGADGAVLSTVKGP
jgi:hypothetical protein